MRSTRSASKAFLDALMKARQQKFAVPGAVNPSTKGKLNTPKPKRKLGYYALPLLWGDRVIGWANVTLRGRAIDADLGYVSGRAPRDRGFKQALGAEIEAMATFLRQE